MRREAHILIEKWRRDYNTVKPRSALGYGPPVPISIRPVDQANHALKLITDHSLGVVQPFWAKTGMPTIHPSRIRAAYQPIGPRGSGTNRTRENSMWLPTARAPAIATARRCDNNGNWRKLFSSRITPWPTTNHIA